MFQHVQHHIDIFRIHSSGLIQALYPDRASLLARLKEEPHSEIVEYLMNAVRDKLEDVQCGFLRHLVQPDPDYKGPSGIILKVEIE